jgi:hypothetical protein
MSSSPVPWSASSPSLLGHPPLPTPIDTSFNSQKPPLPSHSSSPALFHESPAIPLSASSAQHLSSIPFPPPIKVSGSTAPELNAHISGLPSPIETSPAVQTPVSAAWSFDPSPIAETMELAAISKELPISSQQMEAKETNGDYITVTQHDFINFNNINDKNIEDEVDERLSYSYDESYNENDTDNETETEADSDFSDAGSETSDAGSDAGSDISDVESNSNSNIPAQHFNAIPRSRLNPPSVDIPRPLSLPRSFGRSPLGVTSPTSPTSPTGTDDSSATTSASSSTATTPSSTTASSASSMDLPASAASPLFWLAGGVPTDPVEYQAWVASGGLSAEIRKSNSPLRRSKSFVERNVLITPENIDQVLVDLKEEDEEESDMEEDDEFQEDGEDGEEASERRQRKMKGKEVEEDDVTVASAVPPRLKGMGPVKRSKQPKRRAMSAHEAFRRAYSDPSPNNSVGQGESSAHSLIDEDSLSMPPSDTVGPDSIPSPKLASIPESAVSSVSSSTSPSSPLVPRPASPVKRKVSTKSARSVKSVKSTKSTKSNKSSKSTKSNKSNKSRKSIHGGDLDTPIPAGVLMEVMEAMYDPPETLATVMQAEAHARMIALGALEAKVAAAEKVGAEVARREEALGFTADLEVEEFTSQTETENEADSDLPPTDEVVPVHGIPAVDVVESLDEIDFVDEVKEDRVDELVAESTDRFTLSSVPPEVPAKDADDGQSHIAPASQKVAVTPYPLPSTAPILPPRTVSHPLYQSAVTDPQKYTQQQPPTALTASASTVVPQPAAAPIQAGTKESSKKGWSWFSNLLSSKPASKKSGSPAAANAPSVSTSSLSTKSAASLRNSPTPPPITSADMDDFVYPSSHEFNDGFPRYSLAVEKSVYKLSHVKLAQHRRPLHQQVVISNLMLYILSVHADVTLNRQGPRTRRKKKKKSKNSGGPGGRSSSPGRKTKLVNLESGGGTNPYVPQSKPQQPPQILSIGPIIPQRGNSKMPTAEWNSSSMVGLHHHAPTSPSPATSPGPRLGTPTLPNIPLLDFEEENKRPSATSSTSSTPTPSSAATSAASNRRAHNMHHFSAVMSGDEAASGPRRQSDDRFSEADDSGSDTSTKSSSSKKKKGKNGKKDKSGLNSSSSSTLALNGNASTTTSNAAAGTNGIKSSSGSPTSSFFGSMSLKSNSGKSSTSSSTLVLNINNKDEEEDDDVPLGVLQQSRRGSVSSISSRTSARGE